MKKSVVIFFLTAFSCVSLSAADKVEIGVNATRKKLSSLTLQDSIEPPVSKKVSDPFAWQNAKHYEAVVRIFEVLSHLLARVNKRPILEDFGHNYAIRLAKLWKEALDAV